MHLRRFMFLLVVMSLILIALELLAAQTRRASPGQKPALPTEPMAIQEVQEVSAVEVADSPTMMDLAGRLHPALVHFPIGWIVLLLLVEIIATATGREEWTRAGSLLLMGVLVSMLPAMVTGFLRASSLGGDPDVLELVTTHRNLNLASGLICLLALAIRCAWRNCLNAKRRGIYLFLLCVATLTMLLAGHFGGKMVFGKDYLPF